MPACWLPQTQPRTTYMMGNKITPAWGLIQKGSMDPAENWRIPIYKPQARSSMTSSQKEEAEV